MPRASQGACRTLAAGWTASPAMHMNETLLTFKPRTSECQLPPIQQEPCRYLVSCITNSWLC
jgi:hypothetical protein